MNCPYCGKEMALGYIFDGNQPPQWIPDGSKPSVFAYAKAKDGIKLKSEFQFWKLGGYRADAHYCAACKVVLASTEE